MDRGVDEETVLEDIAQVGGIPSSQRRVLTPKRPQLETAGFADALPYYAGFSYDWARGFLLSIKDDEPPVVLDPWNGSGTTTLAALSLGWTSVGVDRSPVANIIADFRARQEVRKVGRPSMQFEQDNLAQDALASWFDPTTVKSIRSWTAAVSMADSKSRSLGYIAVFRAIRRATESFEGSNPTWVRTAKSAEDLVELSADELDKLILEEQELLFIRHSAFAPQRPACGLITGSSAKLPLRSDSVDIVLTSPPYLTRIDYAVAYSRELAVLGIGIAKDRRLRSALMGTTLVRSDEFDRSIIGETAMELVEAVTQHSSKASSGYYAKQCRQYISDLARGLAEINRVSRRNASVTLVVQDSYYKDIPVRLADICEDQMGRLGWQLVQSESFAVKRTLTTLNTSARAYAKGRVDESVLTFRRKL